MYWMLKFNYDQTLQQWQLTYESHVQTLGGRLVKSFPPDFSMETQPNLVPLPEPEIACTFDLLLPDLIIRSSNFKLLFIYQELVCH